MLFNIAVPALVPIMGDTPRLAGITISASGVKDPEITELTKQPGIKVALKMDQGRIIAGAFARPKARR